MAVLKTTNLTLLDLAKRTDPDGQIAQIVELLQQENEILRDMTYINGNLETGHKSTMRTGIPVPTWRQFNAGVQPTKSTTRQVTFETGMLEDYSEMDVALARLHGNDNAARFSEDLASIEGINQELARTLFYGNRLVNPNEFTGLSNFYNDSTAESADNMINAKGGGSDTDYGSIWLVGWSDRTVTGIIPKHGIPGLQIRDLGEVTVENADGNNGRMQAFRSHLKQEAGLAVRDWRFGVRICNIRRGELNANASSDSANLPNLMFTAMERIQSLSGVTPVFYMDRTMREFLRKQLASATSSSTLTTENVGGYMTQMFQGTPIRRVDALGVTEAEVTFA